MSEQSMSLCRRFASRARRSALNRKDELSPFTDVHDPDAVQDQFGVHHQPNWVDQRHGWVLCLVDPPDREASGSGRPTAHGPVADQMAPVREGERPVAGAGRRAPPRARPCLRLAGKGPPRTRVYSACW
jgi:hypothetical protein